MVFAGEPSTIDELFAHSGGLGICYETGAAGDDAVAGRIAVEIVAALAAGGWLPAGDSPQDLPPKDEYVLAEKIVLTEAGFRFANGVGDVNFQPLAAGSSVGRHGLTPLVAPADCLLVFPKPERFRTLGQSVGYLAVPAAMGCTGAFSGIPRNKPGPR